MTEVNVFTVNGVPLVRLDGVVAERNGAELAAKVMSSIHFMTADDDQGREPLSLVEPCTRGRHLAAPRSGVEQ